MRHATPAFALLCCLPALAGAGEIYGKITSGGAPVGPVGEGVEVSAKCGATGYPAVRTDKTGNYHLVVGASGKCALTITWKGASASLDVVSYDEGTQADIVLETKDGKLAARRR
jgi:hypothetical protein